MPPPTNTGRGHQFKKYLDDAEALGACPEAIAWCQSLVDADSNIKFGEAIDIFLAGPIYDAEGHRVDDAWSRWNLQVVGMYFDPDARIGFIQKLEGTPPMINFATWRQINHFLTPEEDALLRSYCGDLVP